MFSSYDRNSTASLYYQRSKSAVKNYRRNSSLGLYLLLALWPLPAAGWGDFGHKLVCEIAFQELSTSAREKVKALIRLDRDFRLFSDACTWPDHPRKRGAEHFINVPRETATIEDSRCPQAEQCLFTAIEDDLRVLADARSSDLQKLEAVKFLGHWVGDLHQPLHVSFLDDRGGSNIREQGPLGVPLHTIWDHSIVVSRLRGDARQAAARLRRQIGATERAAWKSSTPVDWARESYAIATSPAVGYCFRKRDGCWYGPDRKRYEEGTSERRLRIDERYLDTHLPTVIERLKMAGVRLAHLLNNVL